MSTRRGLTRWEWSLTAAAAVLIPLSFYMLWRDHKDEGLVEPLVVTSVVLGVSFALGWLFLHYLPLPILLAILASIIFAVVTFRVLDCPDCGQGDSATNRGEYQSDVKAIVYPAVFLISATMLGTLAGRAARRGAPDKFTGTEVSSLRA